jgi:hypothetical protein
VRTTDSATHKSARILLLLFILTDDLKKLRMTAVLGNNGFS